MEKNKYSSPEIEILELVGNDIVTASPGAEEGDNEVTDWDDNNY